MSPAEFKLKWHLYTGNESSAYQSHFNDRCDLVQEQSGQPDHEGFRFGCALRGDHMPNLMERGGR